MSRTAPPHIVPSQLKIFTPVGIAMSIVERPNAEIGDRADARSRTCGAPTRRSRGSRSRCRRTPRPSSRTAACARTPGRISETMPMPGRIRMYTSGWPKIQNRCCQSSGSPPAAALKKFVPKLRSKNTRISAAVTSGIANSGEERDDEHHPHEHRHAHQRHARRAHVDDRDDEVDRRRDRPDAEHDRGRRPRSRDRGPGRKPLRRSACS